MYEMTNVYVDLGFWYMARSRTLLGVGLPLIFVPIVAASYAIQDRPDLGLDQRCPQHRRIDRRLDRVTARSTMCPRIIEGSSTEAVNPFSTEPR